MVPPGGQLKSSIGLCIVKIKAVIVRWVCTFLGEYRWVGFFEVAGGGRVVAPPSAGVTAVGDSQ